MLKEDDSPRPGFKKRRYEPILRRGLSSAQSLSHEFKLSPKTKPLSPLRRIRIVVTATNRLAQ